jgi:hypothetical protein
MTASATDMRSLLPLYHSFLRNLQALTSLPILLVSATETTDISIKTIAITATQRLCYSQTWESQFAIQTSTSAHFPPKEK